MAKQVKRVGESVWSECSNIKGSVMNWKPWKDKSEVMMNINTRNENKDKYYSTWSHIPRFVKINRIKY